MLSKFYLAFLTLAAQASAAALSTTTAQDETKQPSELVQWLRDAASARESAATLGGDTSSAFGGCTQEVCPEGPFIDLIWFEISGEYFIRGKSTCPRCATVKVGDPAIQNVSLCGVPLLVDINWRSGYGYVLNYNNNLKACFTVKSAYTCGRTMWTAWPDKVWDC